ncbi:hypothetical protein [Taklimakanibacter lacteus]|uniref:hypothetical protein n=1 Tax=Taklimakanibacter lacteus TaxID=2268456 RepID=UPI000E66A83B
MITGSIGRHFVLGAFAGVALLGGGAVAAPQKETFRDWTATLDEMNTGEDMRKTCMAAVAGQGWTLSLAISNGDVLPPDAYPQIVIASDGLAQGEGIPLAFGFGDKRIDVQGSGDGKEVLAGNVKETSLALLRAMAAGDKLDLVIAGKPSPSLFARRLHRRLSQARRLVRLQDRRCREIGDGHASFHRAHRHCPGRHGVGGAGGEL